MSIHAITSRTLAAIFAMVTLAGLTSIASAQDCQSNADCGEGFHCELYPTSCTIAPGQEEAECDEPEGGYCQRSPVTCDTDSDCGYAWLGCTNYGSNDSGEDVAPPEPGGAAPCDPDSNCDSDPGFDPNPEPGPSYCAPREITCEADSDCPSDFTCTSYDTPSVDCAAPAPICEDGSTDCFMEDVDCGGEREPAPAYKACVPREIDCNANSDCPSDWTCLTESYGYCNGSTGGDSGGSTDPDSGDRAPDEGGAEFAPDECYEETISRCIPAGFDYYGYANDSSGETPTADPNSNESDVFGDDDEDGGSANAGCSTLNLSPTAGGLPLLLLGLGLGMVAFRRRS